MLPKKQFKHFQKTEKETHNMGIWLNADTKIIVQGMTGSAGKLHAHECIEYGSNIVAGVTPKKGGQTLFDIPIFDTVREAKRFTDATASMIYVPARFAKHAIIEALEAEIELIVCITEGIPVHDMFEVKQLLACYPKSRLIGPNCPGIITPGKAKMGIMPGYIHRKGSVGIVSRSGTLTYEAVWQTTQLSLGQSTCVGIGGDPLNGTSFVDVLDAFMKDPETESILMIGEIGGRAEEDAAQWLHDNSKKPVAALIAGSTAPKGKRMGHAGAIISGTSGTAESKKQALESAGIIVADTPAHMGEALTRAIEEFTNKRKKKSSK
jgi:succinyl-CoA synthetase alpha subunit